jgi:hypothetical protein
LDTKPQQLEFVENELTRFFKEEVWELSEFETDSYMNTCKSCRPHKGAGVVTRGVRRSEMAAGEGTNMAGRPPLIGNRVPLIA